MKTEETHPYNYDIETRFPNQRHVYGWEGGGCSYAESDGRYWAIIDEGTMADFLDEVEDADILARLVKVYGYDTEAERAESHTKSPWMVELDALSGSVLR